MRIPTIIYSLLGFHGVVWGVVTWADDDDSVPLWVSIGLILGGALMFLVWHRAWARRE